MAEYSLAELARSGIYQIRNTVNGKLYVGSAVSIGLRWRQHRCEAAKGRHNRIFQNAWGKYGEDAFEFSVLEFVDDKSRLIEREQHYIDALLPAYNVALVAGSNLGIRWNKEVRAKMSVASKAVWEREGHREKQSLLHVGYSPSDEHRRKISEANTGRKLSDEHARIVALRNAERNASPEHRALISQYWKGKPKSAEQRAKISEAKRGKPAHNRGKAASQEQKAKQSTAMKAKFQDPEFREKIRLATLDAMRRPEVLAKISTAKQGLKHSQETRKKMADSQRLAWLKRKSLVTGSIE